MRFAKVLGILLALGALSGSVVGILVVFAFLTMKMHGAFAFDGEVYGAAAIFGAVVGVVTGPPLALIFLRRVPLWRATVEVAGAAGLGAALGGYTNTEYGWIWGGLAFALAMALWLRRRYRNAAGSREQVET